jgi:hypothetical protein
MMGDLERGRSSRKGVATSGAHLTSSISSGVNLPTM